MFIIDVWVDSVCLLVILAACAVVADAQIVFQLPYRILYRKRNQAVSTAKRS